MGAEGVAGAGVEAAAVFFMGGGGAGGTALRPAGWDVAATVPVALAVCFAAALGGAAVGAALAGGAAFAGLADLATATEAFLAEDGAGVAAAVFLTTGADAGWALTAGFFTVAGSFDELERAFTGVSSLEAAAVLRPRGPSDKAPAGGEPSGLYP